MARNLGALGGQELLTHSPEGEAAKIIGSSFFRGEHCNFNPYLADYEAANFLEKFLLRGWLPEKLHIERSTKNNSFWVMFRH